MLVLLENCDDGNCGDGFCEKAGAVVLLVLLGVLGVLVVLAVEPLNGVLWHPAKPTRTNKTTRRRARGVSIADMSLRVPDEKGSLVEAYDLRVNMKRGESSSLRTNRSPRISRNGQTPPRYPRRHFFVGRYGPPGLPNPESFPTSQTQE